MSEVEDFLERHMAEMQAIVEADIAREAKENHNEFIRGFMQWIDQLDYQLIRPK
jgi:hypothetical protein